MSAVEREQAQEIKGSVTPRLFPAPLRELNEQTSYGFAVIKFAEHVLRMPLDPWQEWLVIHAGELLPDGRPRFKKVLVIVARQNGKALDCGMDILTANRGWTTMGALEPGDYVFHPDGKPVLVTHAFAPVNDHRCYRVTTTDGRSIVADAEHLWTVADVRKVTRRGKRGERPMITRHWETLTTEQLLERGLTRDARGKEMAYRLPRQHALESPDIDLPIDPYLLGAWLGDGSSSGARIWSGDQDVLETRGLLGRAGATIVSSRRHRTAWSLHFRIDAGRHDGFESRARRLGIWGSGQKRIPDLYLEAGLEQRLALLQGLMDTDGSISARQGQAEFCSSNEDLARGVLYLIRSLGWRANVKESAATLEGREVGRRWRVTFTPARGELCPFRLERKVARVRDLETRGDERHAVSIRSIEPVASRPVRCIKVDREDGLFLAGRDLMVTHNTTLLKVLALFWLFVDRWRIVLGMSTTVSMAKESWQDCQDIAQDIPELAAEFGTVRKDNNDPHWRVAGGGKYKLAAANSKGGRGLPVDRLVVDELREHRNWEAYKAVMPTMNARPRAQAFLITNQGDTRSVVLLALRSTGIANIEAERTGAEPVDEELALFEWSAPPGAHPTDPLALAAANPNMGQPEHGPRLRTLLADARSALESGDSQHEVGFRTEIMCQYVPALDPAVDPQGWERGFEPGSLTDLRARLALVPELSPDRMHASLTAAAMLDDGRVRVAVVASWSGVQAAAQLRRELPGWVRKVKPRKLGWLPGGPAAALAAELRPGGNLPQGIEIEEIRGEVDAVCMGFSEFVAAGQVVHSGQELLTAQVLASAKLWKADTWRFSRKGEGHCDTTYGAAAAVHLARTMPPGNRYQRGSIRIVK